MMYQYGRVMSMGLDRVAIGGLEKCNRGEAGEVRIIGEGMGDITMGYIAHAIFYVC